MANKKDIKKTVHNLLCADFNEYMDLTARLLNIIDGILNFPLHKCVRSIRINVDLLPPVVNVLLAMGFEVIESALRLPQHASLSRLKHFKEEITLARRSFVHSMQTDAIPLEMNPLLEQINRVANFVLQYEDKVLQKKALSKIPLEDIRCKANANIMDDDPEITLLRELMIWFKTSFFTWVDTPTCPKCGITDAHFEGYSTKYSEIYKNARVEVYRCKCSQEVIFPRYNDPNILLDMRKGRCGEWANVFTLMCRSVGLDARYVLDKTDHVWTEVYSKAAQRWIHCDPCEGAIDTPLMYEDGWGKKLSYIFAFSRDEVQDVTWRYTRFFKETRNRRRLCLETKLTNYIVMLNNQRIAQSNGERRWFIKRRRAFELGELMCVPVLTEQYSGRSSGSLAWKIDRGECQSQLSETMEQFVWEPNSNEREQKWFKFGYCTGLDKYSRGNELTDGWINGVYECENVFRKVEHDWKMVYICRTAGSEKGTIKWKFDIRPDEKLLCINTVKIKYNSHAVHGGCVKWSLRSANNYIVYLQPDKTSFETDQLHGISWFIVMAELSNGNGDNAWQHAQILRQLKDASEYLFEVSVTFYTE